MDPFGTTTIKTSSPRDPTARIARRSQEMLPAALTHAQRQLAASGGPSGPRAKVGSTVDGSSSDGDRWDDRWILAIAERGDRDAFARLFTWFAPRVKAQLVLAGAGESAEELVQEVMLKVWRRAAQFDPARGSAATWIHAIARNALVSHRRGPQRADSRPNADIDADLDRDAADIDAVADRGPEEAALQTEWRRVLGSALEALPPEQYDVLRGAYFSGRTLRDVAEERKVSLGTVKTRARLALARLRGILESRWER
jgi:RNA polymerase sigma-70 factor (ECF subfamily)